MSESETRAAISALFDIIQQRDFGRFATLIHNDVDWIIHGPIEIFPFAGLRRGRPAVLQALAAMAQVYALESYEPDFFIVEGDRAAIMADLALRQLATDRIIRFRAANFARIQDGRIIEFREFADSFDQVEQALGRLVELR